MRIAAPCIQFPAIELRCKGGVWGVIRRNGPYFRVLLANHRIVEIVSFETGVLAILDGLDRVVHLRPPSECMPPERLRAIMAPMQLQSHARLAILRRLAQLESELRQARAELKNLRSHDPATADVVTRGARLSRERSGLERRLEVLQLDPTQVLNRPT